MEIIYVVENLWQKIYVKEMNNRKDVEILVLQEKDESPVSSVIRAIKGRDLKEVRLVTMSTEVYKKVFNYESKPESIYKLEYNNQELVIISVQSEFKLETKEEDMKKISVLVESTKKSKDELKERAITTDRDFKLDNLQILSTTSYQDFFNYYKEKLSEAEYIALDLETNNTQVNDEGARVIGFSLAPLGKSSGIYVSLETSDFKMKDTEIEQAKNLLASILGSDKKFIIHNLAFEVPMLRNWLGVEIPIEKIEDTMVLARMRHFRGIGLKQRVMEDLGYKDWSLDLDTIIGSLKVLWSEGDGVNYLLKKVKYEGKKVNSFEEVISLVSKSEFYEKEILSTKKAYQSLEILNSLYQVLKSYNLDKSYWNYFKKGYLEVALRGKSREPLFLDLPYAVISKYGALDAILTAQYYDWIMMMIKRDSQVYGVDLMQGYELFKRQLYLSQVFASNGLYWDEERAKYYERKVMSEAKFHMTYLLNNMTLFMKSHLMKSLREKMLEYDLKRPNGLLSRYESIRGFQSIDQKGIIVVRIPWGKKEINKKFKKEDYHKLYNYLDDDYMKELGEEYLDYYLREVITREDYSALDMLEDFNFNSPELSTIYVQELTESNIEAFCHGHIWESLLPQLEAISNAIGKTHPIVEKLEHLKESKNKAHLFNYYWRSKDKFRQVIITKDGLRLGERIVKDLEDRIRANTPGGDTRIPRESLDLEGWKARYSNVFGDKFPEELKELAFGGDEDSLIYLYHCLTTCSNFNLEDQETWSDAYKKIHHLRCLKKAIKIKTTYIEGKSLGRPACSVVNREEMEQGLTPIRLRGYEEDIDLSEAYIANIPMRPFSALTGRWTSGMHTIPWKSPAREFYGSRYYGGIVIAPDYSQAEVRVLATASQDPSLLKAYKEGLDVHTMTAEGIFGKNPSASQRRYAKMGTFRILYGGSAKGFAEQNLNGDIKAAERIYEGFYSTYPKVKEWIEARHKELKEKGLVTLITNRYIRIPADTYEKKRLNQSQNFPIQGAASDIAADTMFEMYLYIRDNNLKTKPFCFVHDSLELDVHPSEIFNFIPVAEDIMNNHGERKFKVPLKADMVFGKSMGEEIELINIDPESRMIECEGFDHELERVLDEWKHIFVSVKVEVLKREEKYQPIWELWVGKKAYDNYLGQTREKLHVKIYLGDYLELGDRDQASHEIEYIENSQGEEEQD